MDVYERETEKAYGYVLIDNQPGTVKERQVVCEILGNCHAYPNIIQSSVQTMQPTKELSTKVSIKSPQVTISRKPPCKRPRVSIEWTAFEETYTSEGEYSLKALRGSTSLKTLKESHLKALRESTSLKALRETWKILTEILNLPSSQDKAVED